MPGSSYFPTKDGLLVTWGTDFASVLSASPVLYGATATIATAITASAAAYAAAYAAATLPSTRTKSTVASKNLAKKSLKAAIRPVVKVIYAQPLTDAQLINIGLRPHDVTPTPTPIPSAAPLVTVVSVFGRDIKLNIKDASGESRGKPQGCVAATLWSFIGEEPPSGTAGWRTEGNITKASITVQLPAGTAPGTKVWFTACWNNPRGLTGPACTPVGAVVGMEGAAPMAA